MDLIKYDMTDIWAVAGDVVAPDAEKIRQGWGVEVVPRQWWNWFENRQDNNIAYLLQKGIPEWDAYTEYQLNKSYVQRNNTVYKCVKTGVNQDPLTATAYWVKAFVESSAALEAIRGLVPDADLVPYYTGADTASLMKVTPVARTLLDDTSVADMRATLGAQTLDVTLTALSAVDPDANTFAYFTGSTTAGSAALTQVGRNILAAADVAGVRSVLGLGNAAGMNTGTIAGTVAAGNDSRIVNALQIGNNLGEVSDKGAARINLGLGNAATQTITATQFDSTIGRLLKTGDFGLGQQGVVTGNLNDLGGSGTGFYKLAAPFTGGPTAGAYTVIHQSYDNERTQLAFREGEASPRIFLRKYVGGTTSAWQPWVELYHTGNTSSIVSQVQTGIQPTLDAKLDKAGGTVTGVLNVAGALEVGNTTSGNGYIDFKGVGGNADVDARIAVDSGQANNGLAGRLLLYAQSVFTNGRLSVQNGIDTTTLALSTPLPISSGGTGANNAAQAVANLGAMPAGGNTGVGALFSSVGVRSTNVNAAVQGGYMMWNESGVGATSFINNQGSGSGGFIFRNVNAANTVETGRVTFGGSGEIYAGNSITSSGNIIANGSLYAGGTGGAIVSTDGNLYGTTWGGWLSNWINNYVITTSNFRQRFVDYINIDSIGSFALMQNLTGTVMQTTSNSSTSGANLRFSSQNTAGGGAANGTWRILGYCNNQGVAIYQRIA